MCYGPEFISKAWGRWAYENGVTLDFSRPGNPTDNAFEESFNDRLRDECLNNQCDVLPVLLPLRRRVRRDHA